MPALVVEPVDVEELSAVVRACAETGTAVTMRGAGTSIAGNALGPGVVVATRSLSRIVEIDAAEGYAVVEPGVVLDDLNVAASAHGLRVGPDPSTHSRCTLGGMVGNNACGSHSVIWGTTAQNILGLDVVRSDGSRVRLTSPGAPARPADPEWPRARRAPRLRAARLHRRSTRSSSAVELPAVASSGVRLRARLAAARAGPRPRQGTRRYRRQLCRGGAGDGAPRAPAGGSGPAGARLRG